MSTLQPNPKAAARCTGTVVSASPAQPAELVAALMENTPDHVYWKDVEGRYRRINCALARFYGLDDPAEALGRTDFDFYAADDARRYSEQEAAVMRTGRELVDHTERCVGADGEVRWFATTKVAMRDDDGRVTGVFGISRDVTERHRGASLLALESRMLDVLATETELPVALEAVTRAIEAHSDGMLCSVLILDETGRRLRHGAAPSLPPDYVRAIDGVEIGPDVGSCGTAAHTGERVVATDIATDPRWTNYRELALARGLRACWSQPIVYRDEVLGTFAMYYRHPRQPSDYEQLLIDKAANTCALAIMLTREQQARASLRESERHFRELAEAIDAVFWMTDWIDRRVVYVSPAFERVWGRPVSSVLETPGEWLEWLHPEDRERVRERFERTVEEGGFDEEYRIVRPDGSMRWIRDRGYLIGDAERGVSRVAGIATDITRQKVAEEDEERLHQELAWATRQATLGELAASLAHELNQPLTAIVNFLTSSANEIAASDGFDREAVLADIHESTTQAKRAAAIMRGLRNLSRDRVTRQENVDLNGLVRDVVRLLEPIARSKQIAIHLELGEAIPPMRANGVQIQQVIMNLGMNGIAAMESSRCERVLLIATSAREAGVVELSVQDTGTGIDASVMSTIFENFVTTKPGGLGFGLPIARRIAAMHGGSLSWEPAQPTGTRFTLSLPVAETGYREDE